MLPRTRACIVTSDEWTRNPDSGIRDLLADKTAAMMTRPAEDLEYRPRRKPKRLGKTRCPKCRNYRPTPMFRQNALGKYDNYCADCRRVIDEEKRLKAEAREQREREKAERRAVAEKAAAEKQALEASGMRKCLRCGMVRPLDRFSWTDATHTKREGVCKECHNRQKALLKTRGSAQQSEEPGETQEVRVCRDCGKTLPIEEFPRNGSARFPDRRRRVCKTCHYRRQTEARRMKGKYTQRHMAYLERTDKNTES